MVFQIVNAQWFWLETRHLTTKVQTKVLSWQSESPKTPFIGTVHTGVNASVSVISYTAHHDRRHLIPLHIKLVACTR
jgi:hypothetical protein